MEIIIKLILAHLIGDYVLQIDYIAKTKSTNMYHLLVHCLLYCTMFYVWFGLCWQLLIILVSHIIIDLLKAKFRVINYLEDQLYHYIFLVVFYILYII